MQESYSTEHLVDWQQSVTCLLLDNKITLNTLFFYFNVRNILFNEVDDYQLEVSKGNLPLKQMIAFPKYSL